MVCLHRLFYLNFVAQFSKQHCCKWECKGWLGNFTRWSCQIHTDVRCPRQKQERLPHR